MTEKDASRSEGRRYKEGLLISIKNLKKSVVAINVFDETCLQNFIFIFV